MKYVLALLLVGLPTAAVAQTEPVPDDRNVELQLFEPAVGTHAYLTVSGAEVMSKGQFQLGLGVNYMTHPLSVYTRADRVYIDGALMFDRFDPRRRPRTDFEVGLFPGEAGR